MLRGGNKLLTVAQPVDHDREGVFYPVAHRIDDKNPSAKTFILEKNREYEPLAAGLGRYVLPNDCTYLRTSDDGREYCGAYEDRPAVCRDFEVGGNKCQFTRVLRGMDPSPDDFSILSGLE